MDYPNIQPIIPISNSDTNSSELSDISVSLLPDPIANIVDNHCTNCGELLEEGEAAVEYCPNCCYKIIQLHANSFYEAFKLWDSEACKDTNGDLCIHAKSDGGPGFYTTLSSCDSGMHPDVGYYRGLCPNNCPEFKLKSEEDRFNLFTANYHQYPSYYNEKFNIDRECDGYSRGYKPNPYSFRL